MIEKICHIGPALNVQGGISSVLVSYKKLFHLPKENFIESYNGSFAKSLFLVLKICISVLFSKNKFDFYQIHTSSYGSFFRKFLISFCLRIKKRKYTAHIHGSQFQKFCKEASPLLQFFIRSYLKHAKFIICITPDMQDFLKDFLKNSKIHFEILPNPCAINVSVPTDLKQHKVPVKILFSGRYGKRKGVYDLIEAFSKANFQVDTELYLYGDGEVEKVKSVAKNSVRAKSIFVSPWLTHEAYLKKIPDFDFLVLPSYAETFGMSLVEAMGFGLPVISTFSGGIPFVVENNKEGFLVEAGAIDSLSHRISLLANDANLRSQMGLHAFEKVKNSFAANIISERLERMYKE